MGSLLFIAAAITIMAAITVAERIQNPGATDWWRNLQAWAVDLGIGLFMLGFLPDWNGNSLIDGSSMSIMIALPLFLLVRDFTEFLYHYAQHRIPVLWAMHSLHHSDPEMTALTTNRHFWGDQFLKAMTIWPATTMIMSQTETLIFAYAVISLYHYFIHANLRVNFGRLSWILNCPAYHRRHHSRLHEHHDTNFAALFPIFDVVFGTYRRPDGWPPCGLDEAPRSLGDVLFWPARKALGRLPHAQALPQGATERPVYPVSGEA
ncbi:MAG: sterol desaturase family protein [Pseudomonadota bacterium]